MNVQADIYFTFSGNAQELEPFLSDLVKVVVDHGYGVKGDELNSMIVLHESSRAQFERPEDFVVSVMQNALSVIIPSEQEEPDELPGD